MREDLVSVCSSVDNSGVEGVSARPWSAGVSLAVLPLAAERKM